MTTHKNNYQNPEKNRSRIRPIKAKPLAEEDQINFKIKSIVRTLISIYGFDLSNLSKKTQKKLKQILKQIISLTYSEDIDSEDHGLLILRFFRCLKNCTKQKTLEFLTEFEKVMIAIQQKTGHDSTGFLDENQYQYCTLALTETATQ